VGFHRPGPNLAQPLSVRRRLVGSVFRDPQSFSTACLAFVRRLGNQHNTIWYGMKLGLRG